MKLKNYTLKKDGFELCKIKISKANISKIIQLSNNLKKNKISSDHSEHYHNFFLKDKKLTDLLFNKIIKKLYKTYFGNNYCLRNAVLSDISFKKNYKNSALKKPIGEGWHRDSPQFYDKNKSSFVLGENKTYQFIIALDNVNYTNSTKIIPGSHLIKNLGHRVSNINKITKSKIVPLILNAGEIVIIDDNVFHKAGLPTMIKRRLIFLGFSPWYIKPYFDYSKIVRKNDTNFLKYIFHNFSLPPSPKEKMRATNKIISF